MAQDAAIETLLRRTRRIAVVGASDRPDRPSHGVIRRLLQAGYEVVPVNPRADEVLGIPTVDALSDIEGPVDLVDVFRRSEHLPQVAEEAVDIGAPAIWLQSGLISDAARQAAHDAGMTYVEDRCLAVEVAVRGITAPADGSS
ncbi:CoA-binding protein [Egicoccus sp. AB-alg6-2]|uniref:CoA-binding protein n=1 Tax=Egicoccus sp. AB-alg6-2 TaxID=3242692 RepID=UPI00359EBA68